MTLKNDFTELANLLSDGNAWCRGSEAQKNSGEHTRALDPEATKWCLIGGMVKVAGAEASDRYFAMYNCVRSQVPNISHFNDVSKHKDIVKFLGQMIKICDTPKAKAA